MAGPKYLGRIFFGSNLLILFGGGILMAFSVLLFYQRKDFGTHSEINMELLSHDKGCSLSQIIIAMGLSSFLILGSFFGCCGVAFNRRRIMTCYVLWMAIAFGSVVVGTIAVDRFAKSAKVILSNHMYTYHTDENSRTFIDSIRKSFKCCDVNNLTDWHSLQISMARKRVTESCCLNEKLESCKKLLNGDINDQETVKNPMLDLEKNPLEPDPANFMHTQGCSKRALELTDRNSELLIPLLITLGVIDLIGIMLSVLFCCFISRKKKKEITEEDDKEKE